jgi:zinc protease
MTFFKRYLTALLILFIAGSLSAQLDTALPVDPNVRMGTLPNGLEYYIQHNKKPESRAALRLVLKAGSLQEDDNQRGLAHFVEHMAFNGTKNFEKNELINYLEKTGTRFGADLNAYTSFEETVYMIEARTDSMELLEKGLLILEDWAGALSFEPEEIDKERGVVLSEWRTRLSPDQRLQQQYFPVLYKDARYAERLPIGLPSIIEEASYSTIKQFYEDWYRPELMAVVAVGDFDVEWMEQEIVSRFSSLKNPEQPRERLAYPVPSHDSTLFVLATDKEAPFTRVRIEYKHPAQKVKDKNSFRQQLNRLLYNRMLNARLQELQLLADPPFTFAYSGYGSDVDGLDTYTLYAFVKEGGAIRGIESVLDATYRAVQHGFTSTELERQKKDMLENASKAAKEQDKMRSSNLASRYVYHFLDDNPIPSPEQRLALYEELLPTISVSDINPLPKKWLTEDNRVVIVTGPEKESAPLPSETAMRAVLKNAAEKGHLPYIDQVNNAPLIEEMPPIKMPSRSKSFANIGLTELLLPNGVKVYLKPTDFQNDQILMSAFSPGGHSLYSDEEYLSASSAATVVNQSGLAEFSTIELQKKLTGRDVNVGPYISELYEGLSGSSSPEELETMMQLIYLYFTKPAVDSTALASHLSRQASIFENILVNPYYYFGAERSRIKYDGHPRRQITTLEGLQKIELETIERIYKDRFADASDFVFIFVGNFEIHAMQRLVSHYLSNLPSTGRTESWKDVKAGLVKGTIEETIIRGEAPKSIVELSYHGEFTYEAENRYHFNTLLSALRIRLREQMREDKSGVYGVRVSGNINAYPQPYYNITISFNCEPSRVEELTQVVADEIGNFKKDGPSTEELDKVIETQRQSRIKGLKENGFWLGQLEARLKYDIPLEGVLLPFYEKYLDQVKVRDVQGAANTYFGGDNMIKLVLMPEKE